MPAARVAILAARAAMLAAQSGVLLLTAPAAVAGGPRGGGERERRPPRVGGGGAGGPAEDDDAAPPIAVSVAARPPQYLCRMRLASEFGCAFGPRSFISGSTIKFLARASSARDLLPLQMPMVWKMQPRSKTPPPPHTRTKHGVPHSGMRSCMLSKAGSCKHDVHWFSPSQYH